MGSRKVMTNRQGKTRILTYTPEKEEIEKKKQKKKIKIKTEPKKKKVRKQILQSSSEEECTDNDTWKAADSSSDDDIDSFNNEIISSQNVEQNDNIEVGDYVLVKLKTEKLIRNYVVKVIDKNSEETIILYLKKMQKSDGFFLPEDAQSFFLMDEDIITKLPPQVVIGGSKRKANQVKFPINFDCYNMA